MKKGLLFSAIVLSTIALFSCEKKTCKCTVLGITASTEYDTEAIAKDSCDAANAGAAFFGGSCELTN